jgi:hypothetical protein
MTAKDVMHPSHTRALFFSFPEQLKSGCSIKAGENYDYK